MNKSSSSLRLLSVASGLLMAAAAVIWMIARQSSPKPIGPEAATSVAASPTVGSSVAATKGQAAEEAASEEQETDGGGLDDLPPFELIDQSNRPFGFWRMEGQIWIAHCMFTRCQSTGPAQTEVLRNLQTEWNARLAAGDVQFVSLSVDPEYDRPELLRAYAEKAHADPQYWSFLTGTREAVDRLRREGFRLPATTHFALIDPLGRVRGHYASQSEEGLHRLHADVTSLLRERLAVPQEILNPPWMANRREVQLDSARDMEVRHDFQFVDRFVESGIRFRHRSVEDAGKDHKPVHYDHGNGICAADVDNDGLLDLYFSTQIGRNELWKNAGNGRFVDITDRAGVGLPHKVSVAASFADLDNDGDADLYVTTVRQGNHLFQNDGHGNFKDVTPLSGLGHVGHSSGAVFFDYDRDGLLDLFLCNVGVYTGNQLTRQGYYVGLKDAFAGHLKPRERNERSRLFRNLGSSRFEDVTERVGLLDEGWTGDASPIDGNQDGWPDLYVLNMQGHDQYYENVGGKSFASKGRDAFPKTPWGSMGIGVFDFDNDSDLDLLVTDMHSDMSHDIVSDPLPEASLNTFYLDEKLKLSMRLPESILQSGGMSLFGNAFYRNDGHGKFVETSKQVNVENYWPWGPSLGDVNADGFEDVFITSGMNYPFRYGINSLLLNDRGQRFVDVEFVLGIEPRRGGRTAKPWFALDCDGADRDHPLCKRKSGQLVVWGALGSRASAIFDLDDDGDLDIVTNEFNDWPMVLVSDLAQRSTVRFLKVKLLGTVSNRSGLGARVEVKVGATKLVKVLDGKSGYLSQSLMPLYFGLDQAVAADEIRVVWPSGRQQKVAGPIAAGSLIEVREDGP